MNFTGSDLIQITSSSFVWLLLFTTQGYLIGYVSNFLYFKHRTLATQLIWSACLAISCTPAITNLCTLLLGVRFGVAINVVLAAAGMVLMTSVTMKRRARRAGHPANIRTMKAAAVINLAWIVLAIAMLVDVQIGHKLYVSVLMYDHSLKIALADGIARNGVPPINPTFHPAHATPYYYHYFWPLLCTICSAIIGSPYDTRVSTLGGVVASGAIFLNSFFLITTYFRNKAFPRVKGWLYMSGLVLIGNCYAVVTLFINTVVHAYNGKIVPSLSWWSTDQISPILQSMLWVPHHMTSLMAGVVCSIALLDLIRKNDTSPNFLMILLAACCAASSLGLSALVAAGFAGVWAICFIRTCLRRNARGAIAIFCTGLAAAVISIPYFREFGGAKAGNAGQLVLAVRQFDLVDIIFGAQTSLPDWLHQACNFIALPLNYLFGFGFILFAAVKLLRSRSFTTPDSTSDRQFFLYAGCGLTLLLGSFIRMNLNHNDFGWRIILLAQLTLLFWAAVYTYQKISNRTRFSLLEIFFIAIGIITTAHGLFLDRTSAFYCLDGDRIYSIRALYEDLNRKLPLQAIVQHNPKPTFWMLDVYSSLYAHRQCVCEEDIKGIATVPDQQEYRAVIKDLDQLFDGVGYAQAQQIIEQYKIDVVIVKDSDPVWHATNAWTDNFPIVSQNEHARAYLVNKLRPFASDAVSPAQI